MTASAGISGKVTSWGGSGVENHLVDHGIAPYSFDLTQATNIANILPFGSSGVTSYSKVPLLRSASGNISGYFPKAAPQGGVEGLVTFSSGGYVAGARAWTLNITAENEDSTAFSASGVTDSAFTPKAITWSGTLECLIDDTTSLVTTDAASVIGSEATATFKLTEDGANDNTVSGAVIINDMSINVASDGLNVVTYAVEGTGDVTFNEASTDSNIAPDGALVTPSAASLVLQATTGKTYTASAFWTSIGINCNLTSPIEVAIGFQTTGALTIA